MIELFLEQLTVALDTRYKNRVGDRTKGTAHTPIGKHRSQSRLLPHT
ncbi:hypothetical protein [Aerosakkonema funiforme]|nr:hypothetical protein [Aerosakkonema funiforme]